MNDYGDVYIDSAEIYAYGASTAEMVILKMLVDDGNAERTNRATLFGPDYQATGVATGKHCEFETMAVINFSVVYMDN